MLVFYFYTKTELSSTHKADRIYFQALQGTFPMFFFFFWKGLLTGIPDSPLVSFVSLEFLSTPGSVLCHLTVPWRSWYWEIIVTQVRKILSPLLQGRKFHARDFTFIFPAQFGILYLMTISLAQRKLSSASISSCYDLLSGRQDSICRHLQAGSLYTKLHIWE